MHGAFLPAGEGIPTQDIEFNSTPALGQADAKTTREIIDLRIKYGNNQLELYKHLEQSPDTDLQKYKGYRSQHSPGVHQAVLIDCISLWRFYRKVLLGPNTETQRKLYEETVKPVMVTTYYTSGCRTSIGSTMPRIYPNSSFTKISKISLSSVLGKCGTPKSILGKPSPDSSYPSKILSTWS